MIFLDFFLEIFFWPICTGIPKIWQSRTGIPNFRNSCTRKIREYWIPEKFPFPNFSITEGIKFGNGPSLVHITILRYVENLLMFLTSCRADAWDRQTLVDFHVARDHLITFKIFSANCSSNGRLIEWKIALFHKTIFLSDQPPL